MKIFCFLAVVILSMGIVLAAVGCALGEQPLGTMTPLAVTPTGPGALGPTPTTGGHEIPFRTLAQGFRLGGVLPDPMLVVAVEPEALETITPLIDRKHQPLLQEVGLDKETIIVAFWGTKPAGGFSITIRAISISDGWMTVAVELRENDPSFPKIDAATLPYHAVAVDRRVLPREGALNYRLISDGAVLAEGELSFP